MSANLRRVLCARASASTNKDISSLPSRLRASNQPSEHQLAVRVNNQTSVSNAHVTVPAFSPAQRASSVCPVRWLWLWAAAIRIRTRVRVRVRFRARFKRQPWRATRLRTTRSRSTSVG